MIVAIIAGLGMSETCHAQHIVWEAYYRAGDEARGSNQRDLALHMYSRAISEAQREESDRLIAASAARLGEVFYELTDYANAEESYRIALQAFEVQHAANPDQDNTQLGEVDLVRILRGLAASLQKQKKASDAEGYLRHALRIVERRSEPDDVALLELMNALANCAYSQGDRLAAYAIVKQASLHASNKQIDDHHATAETDLLHAALLSDVGDHHSAAMVAHEALKKVENAFGADHHRVSQTRLFLGQMHHRRGAIDDAKEAIALARESLRAHHHEAHPIHEVADKLHEEAHGPATDSEEVDSEPASESSSEQTQGANSESAPEENADQ